MSDEGVVIVLLYTKGGSDPAVITESSLYGLSLIREVSGSRRHEYFEMGPLGMTEVADYSGALLGPLTPYNVRMLHYAAAGKTGLPVQSDVYFLRVDVSITAPVGAGSNAGLMLALLADPERSSGAYTDNLLGMLADPESLLPPEYSPCSEDVPWGEHCPEIAEGQCIWIMDTDDYKCEPFAGPDDEICMYGKLKRGLTQGGHSIPIPYEEAWALRDTFLSQSSAGREYISYYYMLSNVANIYATADASLLVDLLPAIEASMDVVMNGADNQVVLPQSSANLALSYLDVLRLRTSNRIVLGALNRVEDDIMLYTGMSRADLITAFAAQ